MIKERERRRRRRRRVRHGGSDAVTVIDMGSKVIEYSTYPIDFSMEFMNRLADVIDGCVRRGKVLVAEFPASTVYCVFGKPVVCYTVSKVINNGREEKWVTIEDYAYPLDAVMTLKTALWLEREAPKIKVMSKKAFNHQRLLREANHVEDKRVEKPNQWWNQW